MRGDFQPINYVADTLINIKKKGVIFLQIVESVGKLLVKVR